MNKRPVLIDMFKHRQSILGFVALAINVLYSTGGLNKVTLKTKFDLLARDCQ